MNLQDMQDAIQRRPFGPFRLFISDGATYDVRHPELCVPGRREVFIGLTESTEPVYDRFAIVDLIHITRLEPLDSPKSLCNCRETRPGTHKRTRLARRSSDFSSACPRVRQWVVEPVKR